jgi:hypothetical protein
VLCAKTMVVSEMNVVGLVHELVFTVEGADEKEE